jgi:transcriptional regulator with XRE-family HTH domain
MEELNETKISNNLKREIETCGKTKSQIARELGISKPTLSQYLSGKVFPSLPTFARLCKIIDCSADEILGLDK